MATFDGVPLLTALKWGEDEESLGWIETIVHGTPMLESSPQKRISGRVWRQEHEDTLPNVQFRNLNETYTASEGENDFSYWGTTILGGELRVDIAVDSFADQAELEADEFEKHAKAASMRYTYEWFNGTGANKGFAGVKQLIDDGWGIQSDQTDANVDFNALDKALNLMEHGDPDALYCNKDVALQFTFEARSGSNWFSLLGTGISQVTGEQLMTYRGIPIRVIRRGRNASGVTTDVLPFTETGSTSSLYAVRFGRDAVTGLLGNSGAMLMRPLGESTEGPYKTGRLEFYPGLASFDPFSLVRYSGITAIA